jgi:GT2 family glycosyltransferase
MKSFGLIFVLYRPTGDFLDNLRKARAACKNVVAVDNSPHEDRRLHEHLRGQRIDVIFNGNENGLAGAYNKGAEFLLGRQCDLIFLLDQDSTIEVTFFARMVQAADALGTDTFLIGPKIYEIALERCMPLIPPGKRFPKPYRIDDQTEGIFPTLCIISSGSAISAAAYRKLGPFRDDYFIEYVDIEYCLRAANRNVPVYMNAAVTLRQTNGRIQRRGKWYTTNHAAWRRYYIARNSVHCLSEYRSVCGLHWISGLMTIRQAILVLLFDSQKMKKLTAIVFGYLDGISGRLGPFEHRHPHIAGFCKRPAGDGDGRQIMRRKLSHIEHIVEGNVVFLVRIEGSIAADRMRSALSRVQRKHPALRALLRAEPDGLYYEAEGAPEIPLRIVPRVTEDDYRRECQIELHTAFSSEQPLLRVVWLQSDRESDLLLTTSHRICDGMSVLTIIKEVLRGLHTDDALIPYEPVTRRDIIGNYHPPHPWKRKLALSLINGLLRLIPGSRRAPENIEHHMEWNAGRALLDALKQCCKAEGVSLHAALLVALDRGIAAAFGNEKAPKWIENPVDIRRGRFPALKGDMVFFSGGNFRVRTGQAPEVEFWARARTIHEQIRQDVEREILAIPRTYHFSEMLRPLTRSQVQSIVRLGDLLKLNGSWNRFALSNLGAVSLNAADAPFRVKDLRLYMHSLNFRALCLVTYTFEEEMRFYLVSDEKCMNRSQMDTFQREFMVLLKNHTRAGGGAGQTSPMPTAVAG